MQTSFFFFLKLSVQAEACVLSLSFLLALRPVLRVFPNRVEEQSSLISRNEEAKNNNIYFLFASGTGNALPPVVVIKDDSVQANV